MRVVVPVQVRRVLVLQLDAQRPAVRTRARPPPASRDALAVRPARTHRRPRGAPMAACHPTDELAPAPLDDAPDDHRRARRDRRTGVRDAGRVGQRVAHAVQREPAGVGHDLRERPSAHPGRTRCSRRGSRRGRRRYSSRAARGAIFCSPGPGEAAAVPEEREADAARDVARRARCARRTPRVAPAKSLDASTASRQARDADALAQHLAGGRRAPLGQQVAPPQLDRVEPERDRPPRRGGTRWRTCDCGAPKPRKAPAGTVLVRTARERTVTCGEVVGPGEVDRRRATARPATA